VVYETPVEIEEPSGEGVELIEPMADEWSDVAGIHTSRDSRMPSREDYLESVEEEGLEIEEPRGFGIPMEIRVEFWSPGGVESPPASVRLERRPHPMSGARGPSEDLALIEESGEVGAGRVFSVARAGAGVYTFIVEEGGGESYEGRLLFRLYGGRVGERVKEYKFELSPGKVLKFRFVMREAVFWDDDDWFTGTVEGPDTITKFNDVTGLVWKEEKVY
jgi:hypothetical protein